MALALATLCLALTAPAVAQRRGAARQALLAQTPLPSRGLKRLSLSLLRDQVSNGGNAIYGASPQMTPHRSRSVARVTPNYAPRAAPGYAPIHFSSAPATRAVPQLVSFPGVSPRPQARRVETMAPRLNSPASIALGVYFYQNGQCAPGDESAVSDWKSRMGRLPAVWMIYQTWTGWNAFPGAQAQRARQLGGQLMVTWEPWSSGGRSDVRWSCARIADGAQDAYIRQYARAVRAAGAPVMIRLAHEMNGDWYPWSVGFGADGRRHNGNTPQSYVAMWRHVVEIFRAEGATNAKWVWAPNIEVINAQNSQSRQKADLAALYPGDNMVDWIGLSVYNDTTKQSWRTFSDLFDSPYRTLTALSPRPMMIAEMGATEAGAPYGTSKAAWISQTLLGDIPTNYPRIKLVNWFCRDKTNVGEANYRFDSSPGAFQAFRVAANSPLYGARLSGN